MFASALERRGGYVKQAERCPSQSQGHCLEAGQHVPTIGLVRGIIISAAKHAGTECGGGVAWFHG